MLIRHQKPRDTDAKEAGSTDRRAESRPHISPPAIRVMNLATPAAFIAAQADWVSPSKSRLPAANDIRLANPNDGRDTMGVMPEFS